MTGMFVLLGLLAFLLVLTFLRRRILQQPGDHLGQGTHVLDGSDDRTGAPATAESGDGGD
jgi:hypothetical protein